MTPPSRPEDLIGLTAVLDGGEAFVVLAAVAHPGLWQEVCGVNNYRGYIGGDARRQVIALLQPSGAAVWRRPGNPESEPR